MWLERLILFLKTNLEFVSNNSGHGENSCGKQELRNCLLPLGSLVNFGSEKRQTVGLWACPSFFPNWVNGDSFPSQVTEIILPFSASQEEFLFCYLVFSDNIIHWVNLYHWRIAKSFSVVHFPPGCLTQTSPWAWVGRQCPEVVACNNWKLNPDPRAALLWLLFPITTPLHVLG